jgi:hypothetical protein
MSCGGFLKAQRALLEPVKIGGGPGASEGNSDKVGCPQRLRLIPDASDLLRLRSGGSGWHHSLIRQTQMPLQIYYHHSHIPR